MELLAEASSQSASNIKLNAVLIGPSIKPLMDKCHRPVIYVILFSVTPTIERIIRIWTLYI